MKKRFGVDVNPDTQVHSLIGSKEGIANMIRQLINPYHNEEDKETLSRSEDRNPSATALGIDTRSVPQIPCWDSPFALLPRGICDAAHLLRDTAWEEAD